MVLLVVITKLKLIELRKGAKNIHEIDFILQTNNLRDFSYKNELRNRTREKT